MSKATKPIAGQVEAMKAKVTKDRRTAHAAIRQAESELFALSEHLERRAADQAKSRANRGLEA